MSVAIGRRVAQWRVRRRMTQQVFADRIGRSKSWVDKVERGVRSLDRFSLIRQIAEVLRVDPAELLGTDDPSDAGAAVDRVAAVRAALACYEVFAADSPGLAPDVGMVDQRVEHAWSTYRHGDYPRLLRMVPELLEVTRRLHAARPEQGVQPLVRVYRVTAQLLVKVGEAELAWLAADRALATAGGDRLLAASAVVPLGQALRTLGQGRLAMSAAIAAAARHAAIIRRDGWLRLPAEHRAAYLLDAARAHLNLGDPVGAGRWLVEADRVAPAELRCRPSARTVVAEVARSGPQAAGVARLATALGLTR